MKHIKRIKIDIDKKNLKVIPSVQFDNARFLHINLVNGSMLFDLTGCSVKISGTKPDGTIIFNNCTIINEKEGFIEVELTEQMNAVPGAVKCELKLYSGSGVLTTKHFDIEVTKSVTSKEVTSGNEFKALEEALSKVNNIDTKFESLTEATVKAATEKEIQKQIALGNMANLAIPNGSITKEKLDPDIKFGVEDGEVTPEKTTFITGGKLNIVTVNRGLLSSDGKFHYKQPNQENFTDYNLFLIDISNISEIRGLNISGGDVVRIAGIASYTIAEFKNKIESITNSASVAIGDILILSKDSMYHKEILDVRKYKVLAVYIGTNVRLKTNLNDNPTYKLNNNIKITGENFQEKITPDLCGYFKTNIIGDNENESNLDFDFNVSGDIITSQSGKLICLKGNPNGQYEYQSVILNLTKGNIYHFIGEKLTRCRVGVFYNKNINDLIFGTANTGTVADEVLMNDDTLKNIDFTYVPKVDSCIVLYIGIDNNARMKISFTGTTADGFVLTDDIKVSNKNLLNKSINKAKFEFDFDEEVGETVKKMIGVNGIIDASINDIELIYEFPMASNEWACESRHLNMTTDEFLDLFYNKHLGYHTEDGLRVNKKILGKDQSGQYDIYEYDFIPAQYSRTILLSSGLHPTESSAHFGLAHFMQEYMKYPYAGDGFAYLRQNVRIKLIGIANPWGWSQRLMHYGNCNGVNPNRNFDLLDDDGNSVWEQFENGDTYNKKGKAPWSEAETCMLRDWILDNANAEFWIDCHTGEGYGQYDNWIVTVSANTNMPKINVALKTLEQRIYDKYGSKSSTWKQIDHVNSIKQKWACIVAKVPTMTIEQAPMNTRWGTRLSNESGDITEYAVTIYAYVLAQLKTNI